MKRPKPNTENNVIIKVGYYGALKALIIKFNHNVIPGYNTLRFDDVDIDTVKQFKLAEDRETFFEEHIRHNFKYCADTYESYEVFFARGTEHKDFNADDIQAKIAELRDKLKSIPSDE